MNRAILYQIKKWLVPIIVLAVAFVAINAITAFTTNFYVDKSKPYGMVNLFSVTSVFSIGNAITIFALSAAAAIVAMVYKFGMIRADFFQQLPFKPKNLRRYMFMAGLIAISAVLLIGSGLTIAMFAIKYNIDAKTVAGNINYVLKDFNFGYLSLGFLFFVGYGIANYCICACILDQNIGIFESIICILLMQAVLSLIVQMPYNAISIVAGKGYHPFGFGLVNAYLFGSYFDQLVFVKDAKVEISGQEIASVIGIFALAIGGFLWVFLRKDISAEKENTKGSPCVFPVVVVHLATFAIIAAASLISLKNPKYLMWPAILSLVTFTAMFFIQVIYNHGFKLKKMQWIPLVALLPVCFAYIMIFTYLP